MKITRQSSNRIKKLRKARSENQVRFAEQLGVSQATVSSWELGRKTPAQPSWLLLGLLASVSGPETPRGSRLVLATGRRLFRSYD